MENTNSVLQDKDKEKINNSIDKYNFEKETLIFNYYVMVSISRLCKCKSPQSVVKS